MMLVNQDALRTIRHHELELIAQRLPAGSRILELGGGAGWQARDLASRGFAVTSVDLESNPYREIAEWPIVTYDGSNLPFASDSFDAVFSSNVLEHVPDVRLMLQETARVVRSDGIAVHLMPSSTWRFWTSVNHYAWLVRMVLSMRRDEVSGAVHARVNRGRLRLVLKLLFAPRHGEHGTVLREIWSFSRAAWLRRLSALGWRVEHDEPVRLLYTGYFVTWPWIGLRARKALSRVLGSSCRLYYLRRS